MFAMHTYKHTVCYLVCQKKYNRVTSNQYVSLCEIIIPLINSQYQQISIYLYCILSHLLLWCLAPSGNSSMCGGCTRKISTFPYSNTPLIHSQTIVLQYCTSSCQFSPPQFSPCLKTMLQPLTHPPVRMFWISISLCFTSIYDLTINRMALPLWVCTTAVAESYVHQSCSSQHPLDTTFWSGSVIPPTCNVHMLRNLMAQNWKKGCMFI